MAAIQPASAVIVRVPIPPALERLRRRWDHAAAVGVPAHVTVLFPFIAAAELQETARDDLVEIAGRHAPFAVRFARVGQFPGVVYLAPEPAAPFADLTNEVAARFPDHPPYGVAFDGVIPHLTITESTEAPLDAIAAEVGAALPFERSVSRLEVVVESGDGMWHARWRIPLGVRR